MKISKNRLREIILEEINNLAELDTTDAEPKEVEFSKAAARERERQGGSAIERSREIGGMSPREAQIVAIMQEIRELLAAQGELPAASTIKRYVQSALKMAQSQTRGGR